MLVRSVRASRLNSYFVGPTGECVGILDKLFGRKTSVASDASPAHAPEHAVLVYLPLSNAEFGEPAEREAIHSLSDCLRDAISAAAVGEFDGDEFGGGQCTLFMYGPDADRLFACVEPLLLGSPLCSRARVTKRYGGPGDPDVRHEEIRF